MADSVVFRGMATGFKNYQFLKTSTKPLEIIHCNNLLRTTSKKLSLTVKKRKKFYVTSCSNNITPPTSDFKPGDFPLKNWWFQKEAEIALEFAKRLIAWIFTGVYKDHQFRENLPFTTGDLVQFKDTFGVVEEIGQKKTCIKGVDGFLDYVSNSDLETKDMKNLSFVTVTKDCLLDCCAGKVKILKQANSEIITLWGLRFTFQISYKAYNDVEKMLEEIRAELTKESNVEAHWRVSVFVDSYISEKQKFMILVACFVDAMNCLGEYSRIKSKLQMKVADVVDKYENGIKKGE